MFNKIVRFAFLTIFLIYFAVRLDGVGAATNYEICNTGPIAEIQEFEIQGCDPSQCKLKIGNSYPVTLRFIPNVYSSILTTTFTVTQGLVPIYSSSSDACSVLSCPYPANGNVTYSENLQIPTMLPVQYKVTIDIKNQDNVGVLCLSAFINIVL